MIWRLSPERVWTLDRPHVLGILNVTPDSFSDGGLHQRVDDALSAAERMIDEGADGLDIGGESTRPGAHSIDEAEQIRRVVPVIAAIRARAGAQAAITIDTTRAPVARAALDAGADAINDVSGGMDDPAMLPLAASRACGIVLMHRLVPPAADKFSTDYAHAPDYRSGGGVLACVGEFLGQRLAAALAGGIAAKAVVLDPGLGFGKSVEDNLRLIAGTRELLKLGRPILSGLSRKSFTARAAGLSDATPTSGRVHASVGLSLAHVSRGAKILRVHDVGEHVRALGGWRA